MYVFNFRCEPANVPTSSVQFNPVINPTTTLCAALLLPTAANIVGNVLFDNSSYSNFQKTLLVKENYKYFLQFFIFNMYNSISGWFTVRCV